VAVIMLRALDFNDILSITKFRFSTGMALRVRIPFIDLRTKRVDHRPFCNSVECACLNVQIRT
jgi:hypothetical protein